ncbi:MAG TPA: S9 family peptidase, partial [Chitinophagaceae bacterium]
MKHIFSIVLLLVYTIVFAQKKPLDHSVYDGWQSIGERLITADGKWVAYTITPQEGDADLYIRSADNISIKTHIPRGYNARFTEDSRFLVFRIRPVYKETRDARIKKKKPEDFPKDSIGIVELGKGDLVKIAKVKSFKMPEKASGWVAYHREKDPALKSTNTPTQKTVDSLKKTIDSLVMLV